MESRTFFGGASSSITVLLRLHFWANSSVQPLTVNIVSRKGLSSFLRHRLSDWLISESWQATQILKIGNWWSNFDCFGFRQWVDLENIREDGLLFEEQLCYLVIPVRLSYPLVDASLCEIVPSVIKSDLLLSSIVGKTSRVGTNRDVNLLNSRDRNSG